MIWRTSFGGCAPIVNSLALAAHAVDEKLGCIRVERGGHLSTEFDDDDDVNLEDNLEEILYPVVTSAKVHTDAMASVRAKLPSQRPKGALPKVGQEAKAWSRKYVDDPRWDKMIWFWIENPEMMPPGVFSTIMFYRYGKPPQTLKVKGEIMARPYLGESPQVLALRAQQLYERLGQLAGGNMLRGNVLTAKDVTPVKRLEE